MNRWTEFVKDYAKKHNQSYACALSDPKTKAAYNALKPKGSNDFKSVNLVSLGGILDKRKQKIRKRENELMGAEDIRR